MSSTKASKELSLSASLCIGPRDNVPCRRVATLLQGLGNRLSLKDMVWKYGYQYEIDSWLYCLPASLPLGGAEGVPILVTPLALLVKVLLWRAAFR